jgi:hypothetical protein
VSDPDVERPGLSPLAPPTCFAKALRYRSGIGIRALLPIETADDE